MGIQRGTRQEKGLDSRSKSCIPIDGAATESRVLSGLISGQQQEKKIPQGISLRLSLLLLLSTDFSSTKGWAEGSQPPSLYHREIHFPAEIQLYEPASTSFVCRREDRNGCLEHSLLFHNLPARVASSQVLHRKAPAWQKQAPSARG